jgi:hypothetical protein
MFYLVIAMLLVMIVLIVMLTIKQRKIDELEVRIDGLKADNKALSMQINILHTDMDSLRDAYDNIKKIEKDKADNKKKRTSAPTDSESRLDRLNKLSDKNEG